MKPLLELTPRQIVSALDQYIVGQRDAKRAVAIALRNRYRRERIEGEMREEILPNNILMIGPTGVGKTEIARRLARLAGAPFVKVEASKYTEVGYVGRDVEGMVRDLVETAVSQVRDEFSEQIEEKAAAHVEEKLLDLLIPPPPKAREQKKKTPPSITSMLESALGTSSDGDEDEDEDEDEEEIAQVEQPDDELEADDLDDGNPALERYRRTREKFRARLRDGRLDESEVEVKLPERSGSMVQVFGPMGMEEMGMNLQEMLGPMMPRKKKSRRVKVGDARELLLGEEIDRLLDMDAVVSEAIQRAQEMGIIIIDEIDKVAGPDDGGGSGPDVSREGVQRDILPIVEGTRVMTKYGPVNTEHILFIAAGAFHAAKPSDLIPELQGRFPIRVELDALGKREFVRILTEPRNALVKQYEALLAADGVTLTFERSALRAIADIAEQLNETTENIGARRLHTVMSSLLENVMFKVPSRKIRTVTVSRALVRETLDGLLEDEDLSRYIL
ncbi:MAG: ATP-dependent protease ATPase subunit ClpY [Calditrichaeota bacterium]|nr:ATP-dependent protease ATPase subunit ClpY [Calditrichota bacterium]